MFGWLSPGADQFIRCNLIIHWLSPHYSLTDSATASVVVLNIIKNKKNPSPGGCAHM